MMVYEKLEIVIKKIKSNASLNEDLSDQLDSVQIAQLFNDIEAAFEISFPTAHLILMVDLTVENLAKIISQSLEKKSKGRG